MKAISLWISVIFLVCERICVLVLCDLSPHNTNTFFALLSKDLLYLVIPNIRGNQYPNKFAAGFPLMEADVSCKAKGGK